MLSKSKMATAILQLAEIHWRANFQGLLTDGIKTEKCFGLDGIFSDILGGYSFSHNHGLVEKMLYLKGILPDTNIAHENG